MRILYLSISYDENRDDIYTNLVDTMINRNHNVTIVRSKPDIKKSELRVISDNLKILSIKTGNPFSKNIFLKGCNQLTLNHFFKKEIKKYLKYNSYELILYATPPITLYKTIKYCKNIFNAKTFLMLKDIFPQNAIDLEMFTKKSIIYKYFRYIEKKYYQISDIIGCMSEKNREYIIENNNYLNKDKIIIFPNSVTIKEYGYTNFNKEHTVFLFGGNFGKPQNFKFLLKVFKNLKNYKLAKFLLIGSGTEENYIKNYIKNNKLDNVELIHFLPPQEYDKMVQNSDVGIISLDYRFTIPNIPSKFQTYLQLEKPVLAITDVCTDVKDMILENNCGWWCASNDMDETIKMIKHICEHKNEQLIKGKNGKKYLINSFDVVDNVILIESIMVKRNE